MKANKDGTLPEAAFQRQVEQLGRFYGWTLQFHAPDNRPDARGRVQAVTAGWPDLTLIRVPEIIFAELKGKKTPVTDDQRLWLDALRACGLEAYLWRPCDFDVLHARLARGRVRQQPLYRDEEAA
jgi:hypothetical protein